ncbi:MAG: FxsA family protein [Rhodobacteraceae bacterium]|nr:FxsA family protein [Paracoccaceae bacterium]
MWLLFLFLAIPLIEIALFIEIGGAIGLWLTLAVVVGTAILGSWLVRSQGLMAVNDLRSSIDEMRDPSEPLVHGAMILFAGALLLTPGFFTDAVGFALLVPAFRTALFNYVRRRVHVQSFTYGGQSRRPAPEDDVIDGEWEEVDPRSDRAAMPRPTHGSSGWTRH